MPVSISVSASQPLLQKKDEEYLELCAIVDTILPRTKSFAPLSFYIKAFFLLTACFGLEFYIHRNGMYKWYLTGLLGWLFALVGLNIQHDANHGAISRNPVVNRLFGLSQNWIGGSAVDWIHQHVVQHHIETNHVEKDPDIVGNALLRLNPMKPFTNVQTFQHTYLFLLLTLFGFTYIIDSVKHNLERFHFTKYSVLFHRYRDQELATALIFVVRWLILPGFLSTTSSITETYLHIAPLFMVGGTYLSFFFIISHNFEGVYHHSCDSADEGFLRKQVSSSSNVGGVWLCFINGGLNYQIEHHLFPRVSHVHYPTIAPFVKEFCNSRGIPYVHFPTIWDNVLSCSRHVYKMGQPLQVETYFSCQNHSVK
jgi:fatty acid desaturase (delta-4 desaturase)